MGVTVRSRMKDGIVLSEVYLPHPVRLGHRGGRGEVEVSRIRFKTLPGGKRWIRSLYVADEESWHDVDLFEMNKISWDRALASDVKASVREILRGENGAGLPPREVSKEDTLSNAIEDFQ
jgi:hypothetical protein